MKATIVCEKCGKIYAGEVCPNCGTFNEENEKLRHERIRYEKEQNKNDMLDIIHKDYDFKCRILEIRRNWRGSDKEYLNKAFVTVHEDNIELKKTGLVISSDLGTTNFYYKDISSITYDKAGLFHTTSNINVILYSGENFVLQKVEKNDYMKVYNKWKTFKNNPPKENNINSENSLLKYAELYKEGLITKEEFIEIKQKLLGNSMESSKYCENCGAGLETDSKFCSRCGTQIK